MTLNLCIFTAKMLFLFMTNPQNIIFKTKYDFGSARFMTFNIIIIILKIRMYNILMIQLNIWGANTKFIVA